MIVMETIFKSYIREILVCIVIMRECSCLNVMFRFTIQ